VKKLEYKAGVYSLTYWTGSEQHEGGYFKTRKILLFPSEIVKIMNERNHFVSFIDSNELQFIVRQENIVEIQELGEEKKHGKTTKA
jgi:hypothetical protein